ncbi:DUF1570 domain-containing protein [Myxococcus stipitatus]|uniref:DUF1570 domain-containing protein n=1 Tax=Myxococcus stipitatus TaxID=83455 RepID=UPI003144EA5F
MSMSKLCVAVLVWVVSTGCASSRALCPAEGGRVWSEVRSEHFRLHTNLSPEVAAQSAAELEKLRRAVLLAWGPDFNPQGSLDVILLRNTSELAEFTQGRFVGFVASTERGPLLVMSGEGYVLDNGPEQQLQTHELAHYLSQHVLLRQPRWLAEGLAQYLQTTHIKPSTQEAVLGRVNTHSRNYVTQHGWLDIDELWEWDQKELLSEAENQQHYASAWLWVHYLINMHTDRFDEFQTRLARAEDPKRAFEVSFQGVNDLRGDVRTYLMSGRSSFLTLPLPPVSTQVKVRELGGAEVHANRGLLFLRAPGELTQAQRQEKARAELAQALSEDPHNVSATLLAAQLSATPEEHLARARELVKTHPEDGRAWDLLAELLQGRGETQTQEQARESAARLMPHDSRVLASLAQHYAMTLQPAKGLPSAKRAVELSPGSPFALAIQAALFLQVDRCADAIAFQRRAVDMAHEAYAPVFRKELRDRLETFVKQCATRAAKPAP